MLERLWRREGLKVPVKQPKRGRLGGTGQSRSVTTPVNRANPPARALCEAAVANFGVAMGRMHDGPVGPHPVGSCQLSVAPEVFGEIIPWLALNRGELTVFAHAQSGDHWADHTGHVLWLGTSQPLDLSIF
jgi:aromatic ring-cleaving dioxygenase